jgi:hypothetical protein
MKLYLLHHNKVSSKKLNVSPYKVWNGRKPKLNYFKVLGCVAFYKVFDSNKKNKIRTQRP